VYFSLIRLSIVQRSRTRSPAVALLPTLAAPVEFVSHDVLALCTGQEGWEILNSFDQYKWYWIFPILATLLQSASRRIHLPCARQTLFGHADSITPASLRANLCTRPNPVSGYVDS
jgi:hypothetical protein